MNLKKIENAPIGSSQMIKNLLEIFLIKLRRNKVIVPKKTRRNFKVNGVEIPYEVKVIIDFLQEKVYGKCNITAIEKHFGKSESAIKNLFSMYNKGGIIKYYNNLKAKEAKKLIREGVYNMAQIADLLCFDNPQYFSKFFRMYTGMSPSDYKLSIME